VTADSQAQNSFGSDAPKPFAEIVRNIVDNSGDGVQTTAQNSQPASSNNTASVSKPPVAPGAALAAELPLKPPAAAKPVTPKPATLTLPETAEKPTTPRFKEAGEPEEKLIHEHSPHPHPAKSVQAVRDTEAPVVVVPVVAPVPPATLQHSLWALARQREEASGEAPNTGTAKADSARPTEKQVLLPEAALEIRLRSTSPSTPANAPGKEPLKAEPGAAGDAGTREFPVELPRKPHPGANDEALPLRLSHATGTEGAITPVIPQANHSANAAPPFTLQDAARRTESPSTAPPDRGEAASATAPTSDLLPERAETTQPLRSVSLEFTPDGASDVRLRLSERSGEVHVSLHSSDASLSGRLHEGIHDLVGSLSTAGYDAKAWTPNQGRQSQQQQPDDSPKKRRSDNAGSGAEQFSGMLQQPIQEVL
jgi:hypothetical protein